MKSTLLFCLCSASLLPAAEQPAEVTVTKGNAFTFYRQFTRLTAQPRLVAPLTALLCVAPRPETIEREKLATGPHYRTFIHLYANPPAEEAITRRLGVFPVGAVIVKEKLASDGTANGVGGMIKRAAGFDAPNGDWEYFYCDQDQNFSTGRLQNCAACHSGPQTADHVFSVVSH